ncbi:MAG: hypothetical protein HZA10_04770 [Nitrospirae bacterium]|nr:hypothetical protein [Nitrospirota bacterium]
MEERQIQSEIRSEQETDEINLLDYIIVLVKRKKLIASVTLAAVLITGFISLILPAKYKAETKILPPQQGSSSMASQLLSQLGGAGAFAGGALGVKASNDLYIEMLKSRAVLDRIIDRFDLTNFYKTKNRENVRSILVENMLSARDDKKSGIITIGVEDKNPQKAADLANAFVEELKNLTKGLAVTEAAERRLFFEEQLKDAKEALIKSEEALRGFQERTGAVKIDEQARAVIEGMAQLRAQIAAKEVELKVMRTYSTSSNPDLQKTEEALKGLKAELGKLETRSGNKHDTFVPTGRMPEIGTEYTRKIRDFKFNETLYELLTKQYEAAKLDEARDSAIIQVIDKAIPPEKRFKPKRTQMVMIAGISGFMISIFIAFFMEFIEKSSDNPETRQRFETIKKYVRIK